MISFGGPCFRFGNFVVVISGNIFGPHSITDVSRFF